MGVDPVSIIKYEVIVSTALDLVYLFLFSSI